VLVAWPTDGAPAAARRRTADTAHALVAGTHAVVAPFARPAAWDEPARDRDAAPGGTRVVARWADGTPAAIERPLGRGCVRTVAVALPQVGDVALRASFGGVLGTLLAPCGGRRDTTSLTAAEARRLAGAGPLLAAAPLRAAAGSGEADRLGAALLGAALVLLLAELALRARRRPVSGGAAEATGGTEGPPSRTAPDPAPDTAREAA
jgi:hypothetical protein